MRYASNVSRAVFLYLVFLPTHSLHPPILKTSPPSLILLSTLRRLSKIGLMTMNYDVELAVQIARVQTLVDGTPRLTFDCREGQTEQAAMLMEYQAQGIPGRLMFVPDLTVVSEENRTESNKNAGKF